MVRISTVLCAGVALCPLVNLSSIAQAQTVAPATGPAQSSPPAPVSEPGAVPDAPPGPASVTTNPPSTAAAPSTAPAGEQPIGDIVVTANKRSELLSRVPIAVSAIGSKELEARNVTNLVQVQGLVPSFTFLQLQDPSVVYLSVRGINSVRNTENPVSFVIDGVQTNDPSQINTQLTDIERIEILKGPQGSLYGRNAIGGAINVVTKTPTNDFSGQIKASYRNGNEEDLSGSISGPIVDDKLLFRFGGSVRHYDGLITNVTLNQKVDGFHDSNVFGKLYFNPTDKLKFELRASHYYGKYGSYYYALAGIGQINREENYPIRGNPRGLSELKDDEVSLKVDYDASFAKITSVTAYSRNSNILDGDALHTPELDTQLGESFKNKAVNEELRFTSNHAGPFQWVVGAYYLHKKQVACSPFYLGSAFVPGALLPRQAGVELSGLCDDHNHAGTYLASLQHFIFRSDSYAGFGQASYDFSRRFQLTLGIRYDYQDNRAENLGTLVNGGGFGTSLQLPAASDVALNRKQTAKALQPKVTLSYKPDADQLIYATVSRGFRAGGFNNTTDPNFFTYQAEKVTNYEVGAKSSWLGGKLRTEAAAFYEDDRNRPDFVYFVTNATQNIFTLDKVRIYGIEGTISARPFQGFTVTASGTLMDSKILKANTSLVDPDPTHSAVGKHPSYIYHTQATFAARYEHQVSDDLVGAIAVDYSYKARNWFWYTNDGYKQEPISLVNAQVSMTYHKFELKVSAENVFNKFYVTEHDPYFALGFPQDLTYRAQPRRYGVTATYAF